MAEATRTIMVVEDNPMNMELISDILEARGHTVLQCGSAEEGISLAKKERPALILMDIQLPGMDGLAATRILKSDPVTRMIPVIALTSHAMVGYENTVADAGCDGYITKPINTRTIIEQIFSIVDSPSGPSASM